jgi:hypothetical protein
MAMGLSIDPLAVVDERRWSMARRAADGLGALCVLLWVLDSGQYDDPDGDAQSFLLDDGDQ